GRVFGRYVRGQLLLALIIGSIASVGLTLLGVPYALVLGAIAGFLELLPVFGAVLGALPAIIVAAFQPLPLVFYVLAFFVVLQQLEGNVLAPRITGQAVGLHPLAALLVLVAAFEVAGLVGAMVAVPLVGGLYEFGVALWKARIGPPPGRAS
ncbi:MAG: AI-2E family transporter, partial [Clostridia bacterium]|nr:AI-2E family transporter [Clostridia bacterium]